MFYPLSKYTSAPHYSLFSFSLLCRRGEHGYSELRTHLASRSPSCRPRFVPGAPAAPTPRLPKSRCPGRGDEPRGQAAVAGPQLQPNSAAKGQHQPRVQPPARSWDSHPSAGAAATVPADSASPKDKVAVPGMGCLFPLFSGQWVSCFL